MTFWEHLEELRGVLIKSVCAWLLASIAAFALKDPLFTFLFAPLGSGHTLVNLDVTAQFLTHVQVSLCIGFVIALPLVITWLFAFIAPALENNSKCSTILFIAGAYLLFAAGLALNWFVIFPFSFRFLSDYQISTVVVNNISLQSYMSMLLILSVMMGLLFEIPVVTWLLSELGILRKSHLKQYRKYVFVAILILAAVITPTGDPFTLLLVSLPVYLLYELSILIVKQ